MPYIKEEDRHSLNMTLVEGGCDLEKFGGVIKNAGELNYVITKIIHGYFKSNGGRYQQINDIVGALQGALLEFYRKIVAPYEDQKIIENGDV